MGCYLHNEPDHSLGHFHYLDAHPTVSIPFFSSLSFNRPFTSQSGIGSRWQAPQQNQTTDSKKKKNSTTSIVQLTYGALLIHRKRRGTLTRGVYKPASNPEVCVETGYGSYGYYPQPHSNISTEYKSPAAILPPHYGGGAAGQGQGQEGGYHMQSGYVPQVPPASYEVDGRSRDAY